MTSPKPLSTSYHFERDDEDDDNPYETHTVTYQIVQEGEEVGVDVYVQIPAHDDAYAFSSSVRFKSIPEASAWIADRRDRRMPKPEHDDPTLAALFSIRH